MEWFALCIPIIVVAICWILYRKEIHIIEAIAPPIIVAIIIVIFNFVAKHNLTKDTEYWTGYITVAKYYESWNEYIHETCTESYPCGTNEDGITQYCTRTYDCSYVKDHPRYWVMIDNNNITFDIPQSKYNYLVRKFGGKQEFVDLHRDYHTKDGDMYQVHYPNTIVSLESAVSQHTYKNKAISSTSVFNLQEVDPETKNKYKLYDYPEIDKDYKQRHLLGINDSKLERKLEILNALLGKSKQVKLFIFVYSGNKDAGHFQRDYFKGGNKNEFILCLGKDSISNKINWVYPITWNTNKILDINVRDKILESPDMTMEEIIDFLYVNVKNDYQRKPFKDFDYLEIELPPGYMITLYIISLFMSIILGIGITKNNVR